MRIRSYRLRPKAKNDLDDIWEYTAQTWSKNQAVKYLQGLDEVLNTLISQPKIVRERCEINPPVRIYPYKSHIVIYTIQNDYIDIIRIAHANANWQAFFDA